MNHGGCADSEIEGPAPVFDKKAPALVRAGVRAPGLEGGGEISFASSLRAYPLEGSPPSPS